MSFKTVNRPSPNHSDRRGVPVDTIMIHSTAGKADGALSWLTNPKSGVSAHYLIARDGTVYKLVPVHKAAWHAGRCRVPNANSRSIGIEMEQLPTESWTSEQRDVLMRLIAVLRRAVPTVRYLVGHHEWNRNKRDPYGVDMDQLRAQTGLEAL